jgi:hypothetical protein
MSLFKNFKTPASGHSFFGRSSFFAFVFTFYLSLSSLGGVVAPVTVETFRSMKASVFVRSTESNQELHDLCVADVSLVATSSEINNLLMEVSCPGVQGATHDFSEKFGPVHLTVRPDGSVYRNETAVGSYKNKVLQAELITEFEERLAIRMQFVSASEIKASWSVNSGDYISYDVWDTQPFVKID